MGEDSLPLSRRDVRILLNRILHLFSRKLLLFAERLSIDICFPNSMLHQEVLGAIHAAFRKFLVEFVRAARICMACQNKLRVRLALQISLEVSGKIVQRRLLALDQSAVRICRRIVDV